MAESTRTLTLLEHAEVEVELEEEQARFFSDHFPEALQIRPTRRRRTWVAKASSYVGTVVAPGIQLRIRPKCGLTNLFALLSHAHDLADVRRDLADQVGVDDVREFLIAIFAGHVEDLVRGGLRRSYLEFSGAMPVLRGRIVLEEQLRRPASAKPTVACRFEDFTADVPQNQVIAHLLQKVGVLGHQDLDQRLRRLRRALATLSSRAFRPADLERFVYDRLNQHYRPIHALCRLILEGRGAEEAAGEYPMGSLLVDMDRLFERFVAEWLASHLPRPWRVVTQKERSLDEGGSVTLKPDLVLTEGRVPRLVADTKYKLAGGTPANTDVYQALAYCRGLGLRRAVLLYPDIAGPGGRIVVRDGENEIEIDGVDLSGSWAAIQEQMNRLARRLVGIAQAA